MLPTEPTQGDSQPRLRRKSLREDRKATLNSLMRPQPLGHGAEGTKTIELVVQEVIGGALRASERRGITSAERRKLLKVAVARVEVLEEFLDDETVSAERRARALLKAMEIGMRALKGTSRIERKATHIRVRTGL